MLQMSFDQKLSMYARLLVDRGMNVQPGQFVLVAFEGGVSEDLALLVMEHAYRRGARHVDVIYEHPRIKHARLTLGPADDRFFFPLHTVLGREQIVDSQGCVLALRTNIEPDLFNEIPQLAGEYDGAYRKQVLGRFHQEGINKGQVSWCVACPPSPKAAQKAYPELGAEDAFAAYWDAVFHMTMADKEDCIEHWEALDATLHERCGKLDALNIRTLNFYGPETRLTVGLSQASRWKGGSEKSASGKTFLPNIPTFEVFTTPDRRLTEGRVRITRPVNLDGVLVEGLRLEFKDGKIVAFDADTNRDAYDAFIAKDEGARMLGEVALVGTDSPVFQEGRIFNNTLYDENAACHIATGRGYTTCFENGWNLGKEDLLELGFNQSATHQDVMISDHDVDVDAITADGSEVALLRNGRWVPAFM
ncbi:aminopeptidase [Candidatus Kaiserbacteria bacterium]|nr:aminopeptidase [Candidatus Kaiserbacteria bacterium]